MIDRKRPHHHASDGFYFQRAEDGSVLIEHGSESTSLKPSEWASVVAFVSSRGESYQTWQDALEWHQKRPEEGGKR